MSFQNHFKMMLDYDRWAMALQLKALKENGLDDSRELRLFAHICLANRIWAERLMGRRPTLNPFDVERRKLEDAGQLAQEGHAALETFLEPFGDARWEESFDYFDSKGNPYRNTYRETLTHVFNHGSHHRAQINQLLRERGFVPPPIDLLFYYRRASA